MSYIPMTLVVGSIFLSSLSAAEVRFDTEFGWEHFGVTVTPATGWNSPGFDQVKWGKLLPYSILVTTAEPVNAAAMGFHLVKPSGETVSGRFIVGGVGGPRTIPMIGQFLITPDGGVNSNLLYNVNGNLRRTLADGSVRLPNITTMPGILTISLDGVLFANGNFTGPDKLNTGAEFEGEINGTRDLWQTLAVTPDVRAVLHEKSGFTYDYLDSMKPGFDSYHMHQALIANGLLQWHDLDSFIANRQIARYTIKFNRIGAPK